jgi:hypothetical protein
MRDAGRHKRDRAFVIHHDAASTWDCLTDMVKAKGRPNPGAGLIWGLILSVFLFLFLGAALSFFFL